MTPMLSRSALPVGLALAVLMAATRSHHFATALHLPDASWAVFFLAGVYLWRVSMLPALMAEAALIDYAGHLGRGGQLLHHPRLCVSRAGLRCAVARGTPVRRPPQLQTFDLRSLGGQCDCRRSRV